MAAYPRSLHEFQRRFPDDAACGEHLARTRWPEGFACPRCGGREAWRLPSRTPLTFGCKGCGKETSVTAGTVMHRTHLPLSVWFWAAYLIATHSNGMSAKQLQSELAIASYETAWLLSMKLKAAMIAPERTPLSGLVEADETTIPFRTRDDPPAGGQGRSHDGKLLLIGAVEVVSGKTTNSRSGACVSRRSRISPETPYTPLSQRIPHPAPPSKPMDSQPISARQTSPTSLMSSEPCQPTSFCPASIASSPTLRHGRWASITACGANT